MILSLLGVLEDGSEPPGTVPPLEPIRQDVEVPRGEDATIQLTAVGRDGQPANLTGMLAMTLLCRRYRDDTTAAFTATGVAVDLAAGRVDIEVPSASTIDLEEQLEYWFDVVYQDGNGQHWQLLRASRWRVQRIVSTP